MSDEPKKQAAPEVTALVIGKEAGQMSEVRKALSEIVSSSLQVDVYQGMRSAFGAAGAVEPWLDPGALVSIYEDSSALRPCVAAYVQNISGFGHDLVPAIDLSKEDAPQRVADAIMAELIDDALAQGRELDTVQSPTDAEVQAKIKEIEARSRVERLRLEGFFASCCQDMSFDSLRRLTREDREVTGYSAWEVLRDTRRIPRQLVHVPAHTFRILPVAEDDKFPTPVKVWVSPIAYRTYSFTSTWRRFVQVSAANAPRPGDVGSTTSTAGFTQQAGGGVVRPVFFKELGDPRVVSGATGKVYWPSRLEDEDDATLRARALLLFQAEEPNAKEATELLMFENSKLRGSYGMIRWSGAVVTALGTRAAEEVTYLYFDNKSIPPYAIFVEGGRLSAFSVQAVQTFIQERLHGRENFHRVLILEGIPADGADPASARVRIKLQSLMDGQWKDAPFMLYDERNADKMGYQFRLPRAVRGDTRDMNRSTAYAALLQAETQVFAPERQDEDHQLTHSLLDALGVRYWKIKSRGPVTVDSADLGKMLRDWNDSGMVTPNEARSFSRDVFGRDLPSAEWGAEPKPKSPAQAAAGAGAQPGQQPPEVGPDGVTAQEVVDEATGEPALKFSIPAAKFAQLLKDGQQV